MQRLTHQQLFLYYLKQDVIKTFVPCRVDYSSDPSTFHLAVGRPRVVNSWTLNVNLAMYEISSHAWNQLPIRDQLPTRSIIFSQYLLQTSAAFLCGIWRDVQLPRGVSLQTLLSNQWLSHLYCLIWMNIIYTSQLQKLVWHSLFNSTAKSHSMICSKYWTIHVLAGE